MPLFMDIHLNSSLNLEEVARMHQADLKVQDKYGVSYQRYWVNEEMGTVFCLMEGPDKESCEAVHRESHGQIGCNIIEVQPGDYQHYLGQFDVNVKDRAYIDLNRPDTGFRIFAHLDLLCGSNSMYGGVLDSIKHHANEFNGTMVEHAGEGIKYIFTSCLPAVRFALSVQDEVSNSNQQVNGTENDKVELRIGLSASDPVEEHHDQFFSKALCLAKRLSAVAKPGHIMVSNVVQECLQNENSEDSFLKVVKVVDYAEERFLTKLMEITNERLGLQDFNVQNLGRHIGLSRPQLYRKLTSLTGLSPKDFIREQRLKSAVSLIRNKSGNISEIALEVGFNSPSYFAKCFQQRFGALPSNF